MEKIIDEELIENYKKALNQKYNAVCLDIDGTITEKNSKHIDKRAIEQIADLLNRNVPLIFITGRGETGLKDFKEDLIPILKNEYHIKDDNIEKIYVLINDGARLFKTPKHSNNFLSEEEYLVSEEALDSLEDFNEEIIESFKDTKIDYYYYITYSKDSKTDKIINIRFNCIEEDNRIDDMVYRTIKELLKYYGKFLNITEGKYKGFRILQISVARKELAVRKAEKIIGIPKDSMLRIGDRGDEKGNDYTMLDCEQGFSVDQASQKNDKCFPILDENYEQIKGVEATIHLLKKAKILPTICLENIDKKAYKTEYANIEKMINQGRDKQISTFNKLFNKAFGINNGIAEIFDKDSGSVTIPMYEWELIDDNNPLKQFYEKNGEDDQYENMLKDNTSILLRGSKAYYYLLANRDSRYDEKNYNFKDFTSKEDVLEFLTNYTNYFKSAKEVFLNKIDTNDSINRRLILGILDNIRNAILICINANLMQDYNNDKTTIINLENIDNNSRIYNLYNILLATLGIMTLICTDKDYEISIKQINKLFEKSISELTNEFYKVYDDKDEDKDYSKIYRAYREIDNFSENLLTVSLVHGKNKKEKIGICGLSYGGIELPIIYKVLNKDCHDILLLKFSNNVSSYRTKHSIEVRKFGITEDDMNLHGFNKNISYILADDNLLTAKTMQLVINMFYDLDVVVQRILVVRYPSLNRFHQMTMYYHGAVDYNHFFNYIQGLLFPTPYSYKDLQSKSRYLDSLGVFDLQRKKILECLYKNHDFKENTEVSALTKKL